MGKLTKRRRGRPATAEAQKVEIQRLRREGLLIPEIARRLGIHKSTAYRIGLDDDEHCLVKLRAAANKLINRAIQRRGGKKQFLKGFSEYTDFRESPRGVSDLDKFLDVIGLKEEWAEQKEEIQTEVYTKANNRRVKRMIAEHGPPPEPTDEEIEAGFARLKKKPKAHKFDFS